MEWHAVDESPGGFSTGEHPSLMQELGGELGPAAVPFEEGLTAGLPEGSAPKTRAAKGNSGTTCSQPLRH